MSNEPLGIVEQRKLDRKAYGDYAYQAPVAARAQSHRINVNLKTGERTVEIINPPQLTPNPPVPSEGQPPPQPVNVEAVASQLEEAETEVKALRAKLADAVQRLADLSPEPKPDITIETVQNLFVAELRAAGNFNFRVADLKSSRRAREVAQPRQVCMSIVREVCRWASLPTIGRAFGGRDHTTVMHACARTPIVLAADPLLQGVHATVLTAFKAPQ